MSKWQSTLAIVALTTCAASLVAQSPALPPDIHAESLSRLPVVARAGLDAEGQRIYDYIGGRGGTPPKTGPGGVSLHSPANAEAIQMLNQSLRKTVIGAKYFEISALVGAREFDQQYEWSGHEPAALRAGVDQAVIDAIKFDREVAGLEEQSATVILMGRQLFRGNHQLNPEVWARAVRLFGSQGALEITMVMATSGGAVTAGEFLIDPPTLINLGFEWFIQGDDNRNASVDVSYRKQGTTGWTQALPMLRLQGERIKQGEQIDVISPNMFAGSILDLEPNTAYEARFVLRDPDGVSGQATKTVTARTRPEPMPAPGGNVYHVYPPGYKGAKVEPSFEGLMCAYNYRHGYRPAIFRYRR